MEHTTLLLAGIVLVGIGCQWVAWWLKLPAIVFLLIAGILAGPVFQAFDPDVLFGDLLFPFISLGVAVVLFEGGLTLRLHEVREVAGVVRNLVTLGALVTWLLIAVAAHFTVGFGWELALLFGAVVVVTGPTVVIPMLRTMRANANVASVLRWEGIIIDPLGALLAVLVFEFIVSGQQGDTVRVFASTVAAGTLLGLAGAFALGFVLRRHLLPHYLVNVATLALVIGVFTAANEMAHESGLLAVTVMGIMLANMKDVPIEEVVDFKESLSVMIISVLFIVLAARLDLSAVWALGTAGVWLLAAVLFLARPAAVLVSSIGSKLNWRERALLSWVAPRGIVAAAVSAVFALRLEAEGMAGAALLVPLTFAVIIGTVLLQSATAGPLARVLGVAEPEPRGVLIVGANTVARAIAKVLDERGFRAVVADTHWDHIRAARMEGLATYFGSAVSEHAERHLSLVGVGRLLALSQRPTLNALACLSYRNEFGRNHVYAIRTPEEKEGKETTTVARSFACTRLFGEDVTLAKLASLLGQGGEIRATRLSESFDYDCYVQEYRGKAILLFAINEQGGLRVFTAGHELKPKPGWSLIALLPADVLEQIDQTKEQKAGARKAAAGGDGRA